MAALALTCSLAGTSGNALENSLARTPPMGWNSWITFELKVDEKLVRSMADAMVTSGMKDAGYVYLVVDAGWKGKQRGPRGELVADPAKFPSGIKALADYIHSKGLKFGIYTDAGIKDCDSGAPGSHDHEAQDAATFASWGVDFVKEDWCNTAGLKAQEVYTKMSRALRDTGRPITFSMCEWGDNHPWLWGADVANMWRTTGDSKQCWDCGHDTKDKPGGYPRGWTLILDAQPTLKQYAAPGHWNDADILVAGVRGVPVEESRANFSLWSILASPLFVGADLRSLSPKLKDIFLNKEVIAVDQDPAGIEGDRVAKRGDGEVWARPLANHDTAVVLFNRGPSPKTIAVLWTDIRKTSNETLTVRDLWMHRDMGGHRGEYSAMVPSHGVVMLRIGPSQP
ncbi:Alpha-galactosidase precursor [Acidisarcina polymorpha]|uniref:Alpha-galactosidase n=1 Tax=Acidisarcina polymorpha TaxID=2211140 RepID=A0A2Z5G4X4_9BACT|nr:Alpha-galactosidase precursor [Acidisarcina polymorpha]